MAARARPCSRARPAGSCRRAIRRRLPQAHRQRLVVAADGLSAHVDLGHGDRTPQLRQDRHVRRDARALSGRAGGTSSGARVTPWRRRRRGRSDPGHQARRARRLRPVAGPVRRDPPAPQGRPHHPAHHPALRRVRADERLFRRDLGRQPAAPHRHRRLARAAPAPARRPLRPRLRSADLGPHRASISASWGRGRGRNGRASRAAPRIPTAMPSARASTRPSASAPSCARPASTACRRRTSPGSRPTSGASACRPATRSWCRAAPRIGRKSAGRPRAMASWPSA